MSERWRMSHTILLLLTLTVWVWRLSELGL